MSDRPTCKPENLQIHHYRAELEPGVLRILHEGFGQKWGDGEYWRWKHASRPGFSPLDVAVMTDEGKPVACLHTTLRSLRLAPGVDVCCSIEGDFAIQPKARGKGLPRRGYCLTARVLAERSVVLRAGFTSPELFNLVYKPSFGHRMMPTVTAQYRKVLSDRLLRDKLRDLGEQLRLRPDAQRFLERGPLTVRLDVAGFQSCDMVIARDGARCTDNLAAHPDLWVRVPYSVLAITRMLAATRVGHRATAYAFARGLLSGQIRVRGLLRVLVRCVAPGRAVA